MGAYTSSDKIKILSLSCFVLLLVLYFGFVLTTQKTSEEGRKTPVNIVSFEKLPTGAAVTATLDMNGKISEVVAQDGHLVLTPAQQRSFSLPYQLKAAYQEADGSYRDLSWKIDARGVEYYIFAGGFKPDDKISLIMDGQKIYTIPFDWSGRIELPSMLIVAKDTKACVEIEEAKGQSSFCHFIAGRKPS